MGTEINLGLGEYLTVWVIIGVIVVAFLGWLLGTALGGAILFALGGILAVFLIYAVLTRGFRWLLHGSISAGGDE